jgi:hypothetical protein
MRRERWRGERDGGQPKELKNKGWVAVTGVQREQRGGEVMDGGGGGRL